MDVEEKIIDAVHEFPCIWEVSSKAYKDAIAKGNAWKEVSNKHMTFFLLGMFKMLLHILNESIDK